MPHARQCDRCKRVITRRGGQLARYCPHCGERLSGAPVEPPDDPGIGLRRTASGSLAALLLGLLAFLPGIGLICGFLALGLGLAAHQRINRSGGRLGGGGPATAGIVLGGLGVLWNLGVCQRIA